MSHEVVEQQRTGRLGELVQPAAAVDFPRIEDSSQLFPLEHVVALADVSGLRKAPAYVPRQARSQFREILGS